MNIEMPQVYFAVSRNDYMDYMKLRLAKRELILQSVREYFIKKVKNEQN